MANSFGAKNSQSLSDLGGYVSELTNDQLRQDIDENWTVAVSLVHVAFWDRRASEILQRLLEGENSNFVATDVDVLNDALLPQWRLIAPRDAVAELLAAGEDVNSRVAALDEENATRLLGLGLIRLDRSNHRIEHLNELKKLFA